MASIILPPAARSFLEYAKNEKGLSPHTLSAYESDLAQLQRFLDGRDLATAGRSDIGGFIEKLLSYRKPRSVRRMVATFKHFFRFLLIDGLIRTDPMSSVESIKVGRPLPKTLTVVEMATILEVDDPSTNQGAGAEIRKARDHAILELMYASGLRVSEITNARLDRLKLPERQIVIVGKGSKERIVPFGGRALDALRRYIAMRRDSAVWLFIEHHLTEISPMYQAKLTRQRVWQVVHKLSRKVGKNVSPHMMRHACATHMMNGGANLRVVQEVLGHADISTTEIYTHVTVESARKVYLHCHPRAAKERQINLQFNPETLAAVPVLCTQGAPNLTVLSFASPRKPPKRISSAAQERRYESGRSLHLRSACAVPAPSLPPLA
jgi:integrase/recombinase XerD